MVVYLTLFLVSLVGTSYMLMRKVAQVRGQETFTPVEVLDHPFIPDVEQLRTISKTHLRKFGFWSVVVLIRYYVKISIWLRVKFEMLKMRIKNFRRKTKNGEIITDAEENAFLKMITDYKMKIREIKDRIHEQERLK